MTAARLFAVAAALAVGTFAFSPLALAGDCSGCKKPAACACEKCENCKHCTDKQACECAKCSDCTK